MIKTYINKNNIALSQKNITKTIDTILNKYLSSKQKQWAWFIILWLSGIISMTILSTIIRIAMHID